MGTNSAALLDQQDFDQQSSINPSVLAGGLIGTEGIGWGSCTMSYVIGMADHLLIAQTVTCFAVTCLQK